MPRIPSNFASSFFGENNHLGCLELGRYGGAPIEVHAPTERHSSSPLCLDGEFERIIGFQEETSVEIERERMAGGNQTHGGTYAYALDDAVFFKDSVIRGSGIYGGRRSSRMQSLFSRHDAIDEAMLCSHELTERYFGHWLRDGLVLEMLARDFSVDPVIYGAGKWAHEAGYRDLTGLRPRNVTAARFRKLWVVDDRGLNDGWVRRMEGIRLNARAKVAVANGADRVFLKRGVGGAPRSLINEQEIENALEKNGFSIVDPEKMEVREIADALSNAKIVVLVEGSAQNHYLINGPKNGNVLSIQPPKRFNSFFKTFCDAVGFRWGYVVGDHENDSAFSLPVSRLMKSIELYDATA